MRFVEIRDPSAVPGVVTQAPLVRALTDAQYEALDTALFDDGVLVDLGSGGAGGSPAEELLAQIFRLVTRDNNGYWADSNSGSAFGLSGDPVTLNFRDQLFVWNRYGDDDDVSTVESVYCDFEHGQPLLDEFFVPEADPSDDRRDRVVWDFEANTVVYLEGTPGGEADPPEASERQVTLGVIYVPAGSVDDDDMSVEWFAREWPAHARAQSGTATLAQGNGTVVVSKTDQTLDPHQTDRFTWGGPDFSGDDSVQRPVTGAVRFDFLATTAGQAGEDIVCTFNGEGTVVWYGWAQAGGSSEVPVYVLGDGVVRTFDGASLGATETLTEGDIIEVGFVGRGSD